VIYWRTPEQQKLLKNIRITGKKKCDDVVVFMEIIRQFLTETVSYVLLLELSCLYDFMMRARRKSKIPA